MLSQKVTAVIVTYKSRSTIDVALSAARACEEAGLMHCVLVDNDSGDDITSYVRERYPFVKTIDAGQNLGFGRGCNLGTEWVETEYVLFLNPDAAIQPRDVSILTEFLDQNPRVGIVAPAIPGQSAGMLTRPRDVVGPAYRFAGYPEQRETQPGGPPFRTSWVCGAALMMRTRLFRELGGFDPRFFLYFEETDLCRRAEVAGAEIWVVQEAVATHQCGVSAAQAGGPMHGGLLVEHYFQSRFYYLSKHHGLLTAAGAELLSLPPEILRTLKDLWTGDQTRRAKLAHRLKRGFLRFPRMVLEAK